MALVCVMMVLADSIHAFSHSTNTSAVKQQTILKKHTHKLKYIHRDTYLETHTYTTHTHVPPHTVFQSHPVFFEFDEVSTLPSSHSTGGSDVREEVI